jgi:hypothetical protein
MTLPPTLFRNALLLVWGAVVLSGAANSQNAFAPASRVDESCALGAPSTIACVRESKITDRQLSKRKTDWMGFQREAVRR